MQAKGLRILTLSPFPSYGFCMAAVSTVRIYDTLKSHFGEADAQQFLEYLETLTREARGELVTKADLAELRADLEKQMFNLRAEMKTDIAEVKVDLIKWMFIFWVGQVAAVFGLIKFLFPAL
ncbi:MAG: hypothetical protein AB7G75_12185 [Candidatus Binatia bacterium]